MIPGSRSMLSRDKRLPLDTWNTSGLQENVFGNQFFTFDSLRDDSRGVHLCAPQRARGSVPQATGSGTLFARDDKQNRARNSHADICRKTFDREFLFCQRVFRRILWLDSKDSRYRNFNLINCPLHHHFCFGV